MTVSELLSPEAIRIVSALSSKKRLFQTLGECASQIYGLDASRVVEALLERESLGPTGVGHGVALPHARLSALDEIKGIFLKVERPLDFDAVDRQPVDLFFALLAPADSGVVHLKALASVSRTLRDADLCAKLRANNDTGILHAMLTDSREFKAA